MGLAWMGTKSLSADHLVLALVIRAGGLVPCLDISPVQGTNRPDAIGRNQTLGSAHLLVRRRKRRQG